MTSIYDNVYLSGTGAMDDNHGMQKFSTKPVPSLQKYSSPFLFMDIPSYDVEDEYESSECDEDNEGEGDMIYSDFSTLNPDVADTDDDFFYPFGSDEIEQTPLRDLSEKAVGLILENERHDEVSIAHCER